jgi:hypothetical protein
MRVETRPYNWGYEEDVGSVAYLNGGWKLLFETRVGDQEGFNKLRQRFELEDDFEMHDESQVVPLLVPDERFALLWVPGGGPKTPYYEFLDDEAYDEAIDNIHDEDVWEPNCIDYENIPGRRVF